MKRCILCFSIALVFILLAPSGTARAQKVSKTNQFTPHWNLNFNIGTSLFYGDIKANKFWPLTYSNHTEWRMGAGLMLGRQFTPFFGLRGQALYGQLSGIKTKTNEYFQGDYFEFNLNGTFNLNTLIAGYDPDRKLNVYLLAGLGLTNYNSTLYRLSNAQILGERGFGYGHGIGGRTLEGIAIGGMGISYKVNKHLNLNFESVNHLVNSDAVDLYSKNFKYDVYNYTSIGVTIKFGAKPHKVAPQQTQLPKPFTPNPAVTSPVKTNEQAGMPLQPPTKEKADTTQKAKPKPKVTKPVPVRHASPVKPILEYRVQIRARYGKPVSLNYLSEHYHIAKSRIRTDMHNGYYIYTVGSFGAYLQAKAERNILRNQNGITDAFVVVFKNGRRLDKLPK